MENTSTVRQRLLDAALKSFLEDDYHRVTIRRIADEAGVNISMIRYYFGNKEGLYEEMIKETLQPLLEVLDGQMLSTRQGFEGFFKLYYDVMAAKPDFPKLILKVLALRHGPGRRFIFQLLERGRLRGAKKVNAMKAVGQADQSIDPDIVRIAFVSLAMTPMLLKDVFEEQLGEAMDEAFLQRLAAFNGHLFQQGLAPSSSVVEG
jgi:AcrR family transcriptional regulator